MDIRRLRDLPGVMKIEAMCRTPGYFWDYRIRTSMDEIDRVSVALFSLPYLATDYDDFDWSDDEDPPTQEQWDALMSNALRPYDEQASQFWLQGMRWDITDGKGRELACAHWFAKQIIIAESGWVEGVSLTADGSGFLPSASEEEEPPLSEGELEERLLREVRAFYTRRAA